MNNNLLIDVVNNYLSHCPRSDQIIGQMILDIFKKGHSISDVKRIIETIDEWYDKAEYNLLLNKEMTFSEFIKTLQDKTVEHNKSFYARIYGKKWQDRMAVLKVKPDGLGQIEIYNYDPMRSEDYNIQHFEFKESERFLFEKEFNDWNELIEILTRFFPSPPSHEEMIKLSYLQLLPHYHTARDIYKAGL